jgi:hypothetical protein
MAADITLTNSRRLAAASPPWWRFGMVWLVLSGPALVVVAGFATMAIAFIGADAEIHGPTAVAAFSIRIGAENRLPVGASSKSVDAAPQQPAAAPR